MYRLFVAIDLPAAVRRQLAGLASGLPNARWVAPEQYHLTLRFIGEVDGTRFRDIGAELATVRAAPFELELAGVGTFPPRGRARVLWVGVTASEPLMTLQRRVEAAVRRAGVAAEQRKFSPHLTLARFRQPPPAGRLARYLAGNNLFHAGPVPVDRFHLYSSFLSPKGAIHQVEESYSLKGPSMPAQ